MKQATNKEKVLKDYSALREEYDEALCFCCDMFEMRSRWGKAKFVCHEGDFGFQYPCSGLLKALEKFVLAGRADDMDGYFVAVPGTEETRFRYVLYGKDESSGEEITLPALWQAMFGGMYKKKDKWFDIDAASKKIRSERDNRPLWKEGTAYDGTRRDAITYFDELMDRDAQTMTLLQAFEFYQSCPSSWKERALFGIKNMLTQGIKETTVATVDGFVFELYIRSMLEARERFKGALLPCKDLRGLLQQKQISPLTIEAEGHAFTFRGKTDYVGVLNKRPASPDIRPFAGAPIIFDIKTTKSEEIQAERYEGSWQHVIYALAENIPRFAYLVFRSEDEVGFTPVESRVFPIDMSSDLALRKEALVKRLGDLVKFLKDFNLWGDYCDIFCEGKK